MIAIPLSQQIILDLVFLPVGAAFWWLASTGWARLMQGGKISDRTKLLRRRLFWAFLAGAYVLMFGITFYVYVT